MRSWKCRTRALGDKRTLSSSKFMRKYCFLSHRGKKRKEDELRQTIEKERAGRVHYEDCSFHPCLITVISVENDDIRGISLVDGTSPRSCSLTSCAVKFFSQDEAEERAAFIKAHGWDHYFHVYFDNRPAAKSKEIYPDGISDYTWTRDMAYEVGDIDAIEIDGIIRLENGYVERLQGTDLPDLFSVFIHTPQKGADCVADRNTLREARAYAEELAKSLNVPVHDFCSTRAEGLIDGKYYGTGVDV